MNLPLDLYGEIFSFITKRSDYFSIHLVCKEWDKLALKFLNPNIDNQYAIAWAAKYGKLTLNDC